MRNDYRVYRGRSGYLVVGDNRRGQSYESRITRDAAAYLKNKLGGQKTDAAQAARALALKAEDLKLPYTYGDKLRFSAQHVLLVLVALGEAKVAKEGRTYVYSIG